MAEDNDIPLSARLAYNAITSEDLFQLRAFRAIVAPYLESILDDFYNHVSEDEQAAAIFIDNNQQQRAKAAQLSHWRDRVFSGKFDESYVGAVTRIGLAHLRAGVDLRLYIGGYSFILNKLTRVLLAQFPNDTNHFDAMYSAVQKAVFLDMEIASSVYADQ